jgi:hypothetical protein
MAQAKVKKIICAECSSDDVRRDADAMWNDEAQGWELCAVYDQGHCEACEGEASLVEIPLDGNGSDYMAAARSAGWRYDEGGPFWFKPSEHPLHEKGDYAMDAQEACQVSRVGPDYATEAA